MSKVQIELPPKLIPLFSAPNVRYRSSWGGRGSGKTRTFALMTAIKGYMYAEAGVRGLILGAREFMNSLEESSMEEIKQAIRSVPFLNDYYEMGEKYIRTKNRGNFNSLKQEWDITIVERHAASQLSDGSKAIDKAGELVAKVIPLLSGWKPESSTRPLTLVRISEDFSSTCVYITMVFESSLFI